MKENIKQIQIVDYVKHSRSILMVLATVFAANSAMAADTWTNIGTGGGTVDACNDATLGSASAITVKALWDANVSGAITLDSKLYKTSTDTTGSAATTAPNPATVYSKYNTGMYSSATNASAGTSAITKLTTKPAKTGYTFKGFYTAKQTGSVAGSTASGTQVVDASGNFTSVAKNQVTTAGGTATWFAKWEIVTYSITYNLMDCPNAAVATGSETSYTVESSAITLKTPTCAGYVFDGWYTSNALTGTAATSIAAGSTGNKTFYAKWKKTITYNADGGSGNTGGATMCVFDNTFTLPSAPTKTGYTFAGWAVQK